MALDVKLQGKNVIEHLDFLRKAKEDTFRYFHYKSKAWEAIRRHIAYEKDCVIIDRIHPIAVHRGTGPAISFRSAHMYVAEYKTPENKPTIRIPCKVFCIDFTVGFQPEDFENEIRQDFSINVPVELEIHYSTNRFNAWVRKLREEHRLKQLQEDFSKLKDLKHRHPEWFQRNAQRYIEHLDTTAQA